MFQVDLQSSPHYHVSCLREQCILTEVCGRLTDQPQTNLPGPEELFQWEDGDPVFHVDFCDEAETDWKRAGEVLL